MKPMPLLLLFANAPEIPLMSAIHSEGCLILTAKPKVVINRLDRRLVEFTMKIRKTRLAKLVSLALISSGSVSSFPVMAEEAEDAKLLDMEHIAVTGSAGVRTKLESTVSITTLSAEDIVEKAPLSTADLLTRIPGFYVESSGGESANNVFARGIPADGSYRYISLQEDGLPLYHDGELSFLNADQLFRLDETVDWMEAVRGGASTVFASNAPGGIVNFISKKGSDVSEGLVKLSVGDYGMARTDLFYAGPINDDRVFSLGGFYRSADGIRDPGFKGDQGGQIKGNFTRYLSNGEVTFSFKHLDDKNQFLLPIPLQNPGDPQGIPGVDPHEGTMAGPDASRVVMKTPAGDLHRDLTDGTHAKVTSLGIAFELELANDWKLQANTRYMDTKMTRNAIFSVFGLEGATDRLDASRAAVLAAFPDAVDVQLQYATSGEAFDLQHANGNGLVTEAGWWTVDKPLESFATDWRLSTTFAGNHHVTFGLYATDFNADEFWLFNNILLEVRDNPRLLDVVAVDQAGQVVGRVTDNGFTGYGGLYVNSKHDGQAAAFYINDEWQVTDKLLVDVGIRAEWQGLDGDVEGRQQVNLGDETTLADDAVGWGTGEFTKYDVNHNDIGWSVGFNYELADTQAVFGRVTRSFRMPSFNVWNFASPEERGRVEDIEQYELGYKISMDNVAVFATVFMNDFKDVPFNDVVLDGEGNLIQTTQTAEARTTGLELEVDWQPIESIEIAMTATLQDPEYKDFEFSPDGETQVSFTNNQITRIPELILSIRPAWTFAEGNGRIYADFQRISERYTSADNTVVLPGYNTIDAGASYQLTDDLKIAIAATNLTNEIGLTEGNPRAGTIINQQTSDVYMARPILGKSWRAMLTWTF